MIYYGQSDFCGGVWMHPRSVLFSGFNYDYDYDICLVTGTVCYTCLSQFLGVRYSTHLKNEDTPHIIWLSERTPLYMIMKNYGIDGLYDMICFWARGRWLSFLLSILLLFILFLILFPQCTIFQFCFIIIALYMYLFTGLFKLSRISFFLRQVLVGSWVMGRECDWT